MKSFFLTIFLIFSTSILTAEPVLTKIGTFSCGQQPKQVLFSPDSKVIALPLLDDNGFDIFDIKEKKVVKRLSPPNAEKLGFAEGLFIKEKDCFFVSQMTTGTIYEYSYPDFKLKRSISTKGEWSKFIAYNHDKNLLAVSNWISNNVSLIDYETGKLISHLKTSASPRGLLFTDNGKSIIVLCFDGGKIQKFNTESGALEKEVTVNKSAMRHIVSSSDGKKAYVSDMYFRQIYEIDLSTLEILRKVQVHNNPNTIAYLGKKPTLYSFFFSLFIFKLNPFFSSHFSRILSRTSGTESEIHLFNLSSISRFFILYPPLVNLSFF